MSPEELATKVDELKVELRQLSDHIHTEIKKLDQRIANDHYSIDHLKKALGEIIRASSLTQEKRDTLLQSIGDLWH